MNGAYMSKYLGPYQVGEFLAIVIVKHHGEASNLVYEIDWLPGKRFYYPIIGSTVPRAYHAQQVLRALWIHMREHYHIT